jgi:hypothetical protein
MLWQDRIDYRKEAVNVMYKEITEMLKDFQRNKIRTYQWTEHEIDTFQIKMTDENGNKGKLEAWYTYVYCVIENIDATKEDTIVPCYDENWDLTASENLVWSWHYEYISLIDSEKNYTAKKNIKNIDKFLFKSSWETNIINMFKDWLYEIWYDYIEEFDATISGLVVFANDESSTTVWGGGDFNAGLCAQIRDTCINSLCPNRRWWPRWQYYQQQCKRSKMKSITPQSMAVLQTQRGIWWVGTRKKMDGCLQKEHYNDHSCSASQRRTNEWSYNDWTTIISYHEYAPETSEIDTYFSFSIYAAEKNWESCNTTEWTEWKTWQPIWKITINTVTKTANLERCNNDKVTNWIDCWLSTCE